MESKALSPILEQELSKINPSEKVIQITPLGGGSINTALSVRTTGGNYFVKYNVAQDYPEMFRLEAKNLQILDECRAIRIPKVVTTFQSGELDFLVLEKIDSGAPHYDFWNDFGRQLAEVHKNTSDYYGLEFDNYVGSIPQVNTPTASWVDFFVRYRLETNLRRAFDDGKADDDMVKKFEALYQKLPEIFPEEQPALLHGDLWSGNMMPDEDGDPVIFDPAVYYGHREMDLAMTKLFGGFEAGFYESYQEAFPLEKNWEQRVAICNLYPLLIHVNLFKGSYMQSIRNIIARF